MPHTSIHMHILIWLYDLTLSLNPLFDFTTYVLQVCSFMFSSYLWTPLYALVIGRERHSNTIALVRIHKYHIYWEIWECHTIEALSFIFENLQKLWKIVEQRTWDTVLDLIVLSFNYSRPKWRLKSSMVKYNMGKFKSKINLF
jgi:hypothetical protein